MHRPCKIFCSSMLCAMALTLTSATTAFSVDSIAITIVTAGAADPDVTTGIMPTPASAGGTGNTMAYVPCNPNIAAGPTGYDGVFDSVDISLAYTVETPGALPFLIWSLPSGPVLTFNRYPITQVEPQTQNNIEMVTLGLDVVASWPDFSSIDLNDVDKGVYAAYKNTALATSSNANGDQLFGDILTIDPGAMMTSMPGLLEMGTHTLTAIITEPGNLQNPKNWIAWDVKTLILGTPFTVPNGTTFLINNNNGQLQKCQ